MTRATSLRSVRFTAAFLSAATLASGCSAVQEAATDALAEDTSSTVITTVPQSTTTLPPDAVLEELNLADIPVDAVPFVDPEGAYVIDLDPRWTEAAAEQGVETWFTGTGTENFQNNVNIRNSPIEEGGSTQIAEILDLNWQGISEGIPGAVRENSGSISTAADPNSGFLQWSAEINGQQLDFVSYFGVWNSQLVTLTYTQAAGGPDAFTEALPYIVTLRRPE